MRYIYFNIICLLLLTATNLSAQNETKWQNTSATSHTYIMRGKIGQKKNRTEKHKLLWETTLMAANRIVSLNTDKKTVDSIFYIAIGKTSDIEQKISEIMASHYNATWEYTEKPHFKQDRNENKKWYCIVKGRIKTTKKTKQQEKQQINQQQKISSWQNQMDILVVQFNDQLEKPGNNKILFKTLENIELLHKKIRESSADYAPEVKENKQTVWNCKKQFILYLTQQLNELKLKYTEFNIQFKQLVEEKADDRIITQTKGMLDKLIEKMEEKKAEIDKAYKLLVE